MHRIFVHWLVSVIVAWVPPGKKIEVYPDSWETQEQALERYHRIAEDMLDVVFDPEEEPLFQGPSWKARLDTALLMSSFALKESGFRRDVDMGIGKLSRGDQGRSVCLMQIQTGSGYVPLPGEPGTWKAEDLLSDRKKCFRAALRMLRRSMSSCKGDLASRLTGYTSGSCDKGLHSSQVRVRAFYRAKEKHPIHLPLVEVGQHGKSL